LFPTFLLSIVTTVHADTWAKFYYIFGFIVFSSKAQNLCAVRQLEHAENLKTWKPIRTVYLGANHNNKFVFDAGIRRIELDEKTSEVIELCPGKGCGQSVRCQQLAHQLRDRGTTDVIPSKTSRKVELALDDLAYKGRNVIERMFCRLKDFRRVATRYDKLAHNFLSAIALAAVVTCWAA
jgi:DDE family transposase